MLLDGLLAAELTTQGDREALVQSLARVWKCATARQRRYLLYLYPFGLSKMIPDLIGIGGQASMICTLASEQAIEWRGVMDTSLLVAHKCTCRQ